MFRNPWVMTTNSNGSTSLQYDANINFMNQQNMLRQSAMQHAEQMKLLNEANAREQYRFEHRFDRDPMEVQKGQAELEKEQREQIEREKLHKENEAARDEYLRKLTPEQRAEGEAKLRKSTEAYLRKKKAQYKKDHPLKAAVEDCCSRLFRI